MKNGFVKIYNTEQVLLDKLNSYSAYKVYRHLKGDNSYFKKPFMDMQKYIMQQINITESTLKRAIKDLKSVGLIETKKKGRVNYYTLPYANGEELVEIEDYQTTSLHVEEENKVEISENDIMEILNDPNYETDGYSEELYDWIDNNNDAIEGATNAMADSQIMQRDTPLSKMGYETIQNLLKQLRGKDFKDAVEYIETRITTKVKRVA